MPSNADLTSEMVSLLFSENWKPQDFHSRDIAFAAHQLSLATDNFQATDYTETTRLRHQRHALAFFGFAPFDKSAKSILAIEVATMARMHLKSQLIFDRCVDFLIQHRIQVPTARRLADLIRAGLHRRKTELIALMDSQLSDGTRNLLDELFTAPDDQNRYRLTASEEAVAIDQAHKDHQTSPQSFYRVM